MVEHLRAKNAVKSVGSNCIAVGQVCDDGRILVVRREVEHIHCRYFVAAKPARVNVVTEIQYVTIHVAEQAVRNFSM